MATGREPHRLNTPTSQAWRQAILQDIPDTLQDLINKEVEEYCPSRPTKDAFFQGLADMDFTCKAFDEVPPFIFAVMKQSVGCVRVLLDAGCSADTVGPSGITALHMAVQTGNHEIVSILIDGGANINATTASGKTTLHFAADIEDADLIRMLVHRGTPINVADITGNSPIHHAAEKGSEKCVDMLLSLGASIDCCDKDGDTPLHYAASRGNMDLMKLVISRGMNIQATNRVGRTPLHMAAYYGRTEALQYLVEHRAPVNAKDIRGQTPLHRAAVDGSVGCVHKLLEHGATVMDQDLVDGCTPLHLAAGNNADLCVRMLIDYGASVNRPVDVDGNTPLHSAIVPYGPSAGFDCEDTVLQLLEAGANVDAVNLHGETPLWWAILGEHNQALRILLQINCDLDHLLSGNTIRQKWRLSWPGQWDHMCHGLKYTLWRKDWCATLCMLVAGCDPGILRTEPESKKALLAGLKGLDQKDHWEEYVLGICSQPLTLQATARTAIRSALGRGKCVGRTIEQLPLPENLLIYLALEEVADIDFT